MNRPNIERVIGLHRLLLDFRNIERVVHLKKETNHVQENDVEHSYFLAMAAWFLADYFPKLDRDLLIRFALTHDLVEVHAGDTYIFADKKTMDSKHKRESAALKKLQADWPDFLSLTETIEEYELKKSSEAKFIYALDKIMPIIAIYINEGHTWQNEKLTLEALHQNKQPKVSGSPEINDYYEQLYKLLQKNIHLFRDTSQQK